MQRQREHYKLFWLTAVIAVIACLAMTVVVQFWQIREIKEQIQQISRNNDGSDREPYSSSAIDFELCSQRTNTDGNWPLDKKGRSVCLIQGEYLFTDSSGVCVSWYDVRGVVAASNIEAEYSDDNRRVDIQYTGSGFLIDSRGYIVTNKHIASPWSETQRDQRIINAGFSPKVVMLRAFFPGVEKPYDLELLASSENDDLALLKIKDYGGGIPALECDYDGSVTVGMPVTVLGYPTGFDLITARIDSGDNSLNCSSFDELGLLLSSRMLIRPMATGGICGQIAPGKIAYDAPTAIGASGSPVFNRNGKVIAVNTALLKGFTGTNFGVPASRLRAFLDRNSVTVNR